MNSPTFILNRSKIIQEFLNGFSVEFFETSTSLFETLISWNYYGKFFKNSFEKYLTEFLEEVF